MRKLLLASVAAFIGAGAIVAVAQLNPAAIGGLMCGPVGLGCPFLRTVPGNAANPSQSSTSDIATGEWYPTTGMTSFSANGVEIERIAPAGVFPGGRSVSALTTAGAGTITAAMMVSGLVNRTGPTAGFTDTTDTAANIDAAIALGSNSNTAAVPVGMSFDFEYAVGVAFAATLAGGTNVTIAGSTGVVASGSRLIRCVKTAATPTYTCG